MEAPHLWTGWILQASSFSFNLTLGPGFCSLNRRCCIFSLLCFIGFVSLFRQPIKVTVDFVSALQGSHNLMDDPWHLLKY